MTKLKQLFYPTKDPTPAQCKNSQRILLVQGAVASVLFSLGTGNFLAGYLTTLGATPAQIAQITAIPQLGCVLQLIAPLFFERQTQRKLSIVVMCFLFRFSVGFTVFAPYWFAEQTTRLLFVFMLYSVAFLVAGFVTPALNQLHEPKSPTMPNITPAALLDPLRDKHYRPLLVYEILCYVSMMFSSGFLSVYQLEVLHLSHTFITSVAIVTSVLGMVSIWVWGHVADRTYWTVALLGARIISTLCMFGWWLVPVESARFVAPLLMALSATGTGATGMSGLSLQYDHCPPAGKTTYLGVTAAIASIIGYGATLLGSSVQQRLEPALVSRSIAVLFAISGVLSVVSLVYGWLRLPRSKRTTE